MDLLSRTPLRQSTPIYLVLSLPEVAALQHTVLGSRHHSSFFLALPVWQVLAFLVVRVS